MFVSFIKLDLYSGLDKLWGVPHVLSQAPGLWVLPRIITCHSWFVPLQDVTEEDIESELAVIHSQMAYIIQLQGRTDEALQLYNQVIKLK